MSPLAGRSALFVLLMAWLSGGAQSAVAAEQGAPEAVPALPDAAATIAPDGTPPAGNPVEPGPQQVVEPDLTEQQVSGAARIRLDQARDSVVQIRGFFGGASSSAFHGSGFAVNDDGLIVTNYHVISEAMLHPRQYRLEYVTSSNRTGRLQVYAVDVRNDLAIVKAEDMKLPPLRLRTQIPGQGDRAYSIGFPLNLGLTITEGVANGLVVTGFDQRIHYSGAINSGMSGGPALDANGRVYGVNVSVVAGRQLVGFVVPARHIEPLVARARAPLETTLSARQVREMVTSQALAHQAVVFAPAAGPVKTQTIYGFTLPAQLGPAIYCSTTGASESSERLRTEIIGCSARAGVLVQGGLAVGDLVFQHRVIRAQDLHPLQVAKRVNDIAAGYPRLGQRQHVAPFSCRNSLVSLDGFDARVSTCARQYRLFAGLYDIALTVTSIDDAESVLISQLDLKGVGYEPGMQFVRRYLEAMRWTP